mmetsp:Transcript_8227/g.12195  ORF Transcript_8227/g.12195 Transcript_8227/m.12195 type:complete len:231 (-) Transcript_8227:23-715(-)
MEDEIVFVEEEIERRPVRNLNLIQWIIPDQNKSNAIKKKSRWLHKILAPFVFFILILTSTTALTQILAEQLMDGKEPAYIMLLHQGAFWGSAYGETLTVIYHSVVISVVILTGITLFQIKLPIKNNIRTKSLREFHHRVAQLFFAWFAYMSLSGIIYRVLRNWFSVEKASINWIMYFHKIHYSFAVRLVVVICELIIIYSVAIPGLVMYLRPIFRKYNIPLPRRFFFFFF